MRNIFTDQEQFMKDRLGDTAPEVIGEVVRKWNADHETIIYSSFTERGFALRSACSARYKILDGRAKAIDVACDYIYPLVAFYTVQDICGLKHPNDQSPIKNAMVDLLKHTLSTRIVDSIFQMYDVLSNGGKMEVYVPPCRKRMAFFDPSMTLRRIRVLNTLTTAELARRIGSRSRQHLSDVEYGYEKPSVCEIAAICVIFGESLSDWRRASPSVDAIVRRYECYSLNSIDDLMAQSTDRLQTVY